jgi:O-antigen ligase
MRHTNTQNPLPTILALLLVGGVVAVLLIAGIGFRDSTLGIYMVGGIMGLALAGAIFLYPELGAYVLTLTVFTNISSVFTDNGFPGINKPLVVLVFVSVVANRLTNGKALFNFKRIELFFIAYGFAILLSAFVARERGESFALFVDFIKDFVIFLCIIYALETAESWHRALWMVIIATAFLAAISSYQIITDQYSNSFFGFAHADIGDADYDVFAGRITGPFGDPNFFGQVLMAVLPLAIYRIIAENSWLWRGLAIGSAGLILFAVMNTFSRGAFVALVLMVALIMVERRVRPRMVLALGLVGVMGLFLMPAGYLERLDTFSLFTADNPSSVTEESSFRGRASEMISGLYMFGDHPFLGVGAGNYIVNYQRYASRVGFEQRNEARRAHSLYIETLAETGLFGFVSFAGIFLTLLYELNQARRKNRTSSPPISQWQTHLPAIQIGILCYLTTSILLHNSYIRYLWLLVALATAATRLAKMPASSSAPNTQNDRILWGGIT